ncbi:MAG TPA: hypothetical protein VEA63_11115, partial [Opitutus sp.]|nr:hypothetical protein [Opitutus sp.]
RSLVPLVLCLALPCGPLGCSSMGPGTAAVATVSAVAVGGTLSPLNSAYDAVTNKEEKTRARFAALHARLDPICEQKIAAILARDPIADARMLHAAGVVAPLSSVPGNIVYPGLWGNRYDVSKLVQNDTAARDSALYQELATLMNPYAEDLTPSPDEPRHYHNEVFRRFLEVAGDYKATFNREMYRLETGYSEPPEPARRRLRQT